MRRLVMVIVVIVAGVVAFDYLAPQQAATLALAAERARCGFAEKSVDIPGFTVPYLEGGSGDPLVLIHGFGADKDNFVRVSSSLADHYRVIIPDVPGFGESDKPTDVTYTIEEQVERLHAVVSRLGLKRIHMGGNSMGGFLSASYAFKYPEEVASLWLLDPSGTHAGKDAELHHLIATQNTNLLLSKTPADFEQTMAHAMSKRPWMPYSVKHHLAQRAAADYTLHSAIFNQISDTYLEDYAGTIATPTLLIWGKEDRFLNPKAAETYRTKLSSVKVILMDGIGHLPMLESPQQTAVDYLAFREVLSKTAL